MTPHDVAHQLWAIHKECIKAETFTNSCTCIDHIRNARDIATKTIDKLGISIVDNNFDPLM